MLSLGEAEGVTAQASEVIDAPEVVVVIAVVESIAEQDGESSEGRDGDRSSSPWSLDAFTVRDGGFLGAGIGFLWEGFVMRS